MSKIEYRETMSNEEIYRSILTERLDIPKDKMYEVAIRMYTEGFDDGYEQGHEDLKDQLESLGYDTGL